MKLLLLSILTSASLAGYAQKLLTPSEKSFGKKWIKNANYQMTWYAFKDTLPMEIGTVTTQILKGNEILTVVTAVSMKHNPAPWVDSTVADLKTLQPIRHASYNGQRDMVLHFGKVVTGYYNDKTKKTYIPISDTTGQNYFDSNLYPALLAWLPLAEGYTQDMAIYDYNPAATTGVLKASVKAVTSGKYPTEKNGIRDVWVVTVTDEIGNGKDGASIYYFDKADRMLWKQEIKAGKRQMMMKRIE